MAELSPSSEGKAPDVASGVFRLEAGGTSTVTSSGLRYHNKADSCPRSAGHHVNSLEKPYRLVYQTALSCRTVIFMLGVYICIFRGWTWLVKLAGEFGCRGSIISEVMIDNEVRNLGQEYR